MPCLLLILQLHVNTINSKHLAILNNDFAKSC